ncbi:hypothetical protein HanRHA438_Chr03g0141321 [Helianthus annuus]|uniref:Transposase (putative) gypsy type domain-containing protein n=1 Tax=Helianthus annuus TaxID=4232 RepID=A0A9K3JI45_HELAN|nr:hypothetical protein HanXRQr2_Chr03g0129781 [Helianthus annuus]KAJ0594395.1 hypothetical protein HanHA300_Chr03g0108121 [Helianthus annuus]KAJ0602565.1 hypothetical protein HanIR_Chr03g0141171 [Helianthus annuus]KAJ0609428.1 hypothetical protein HanHA89_Chr03g0119921 [Helianthus annuus]KAJ0769489.1 hypothetical protein HanLR1_Chr03g0113321 [Helianthus annuus]
MASPSIPSPLSSPVEENVENVEAGDALPILKWTVASFRALMLNVRMSDEYGARFPAEDDTTADAPAGYVTLFVDFFGEGNFRMPLTVFMANLLEYYKIHISQLSSLGMVRVHHFEYCFRSQEIEPTVEHFRRFYQMHDQLGFYSFIARKGRI